MSKKKLSSSSMREHTQRKRRKVKITVVRRLNADPSPLTLVVPIGACDLFTDGQEFVVHENGNMPEGFCQAAWITLNPDIETLAWGGEFPWYNEKGTALRCCKDGVRPVIFKLERV